MNNLLQDLRFAVRQMLRSPGFALTSVLTLALGIAANVIVFGVLDSLILRPIDVPHAEQVWQLGTTVLAYPVFSYPEARAFATATRSSRPWPGMLARSSAWSPTATRA